MSEATPLLTVSDLSAGYGRDRIIADISFSLEPGEILCLVGESGCGKSTLLKALYGTSPGLRIFTGSILLEGVDVVGLSAKDSQRTRCDKIGFVFQNPGSAFNPIRSYRKQFVETLKSHRKYDSSTFNDKVDQAFSKLGLKDSDRILNSCPYEMSGGMNQRIALALALLMDQRLLFVDEPTSALDATIQLRVAEELRRLRDVSGIAQIIVTHNLALAQYLADRIGVIYAGRLVELGSCTEVIRHPHHWYTQCLLSAVPTMRGNMPSGVPGQPPAGGVVDEGCAFYARCPGRKDACSNRAYQFRDVGRGHYTSCDCFNGGMP